MAKTTIPWADYSWNLWRGCQKVGPGCEHCWVERIMRRRGEDFGQLYMALDRDGLPLHLNDPLHWKDPSRVFVQDMGDLFDSRVPDQVIDLAFEVMRKAYWHTHLLLTKRVNRMRRYLLNHMDVWWRKVPPQPEDTWWPLPNVWIGTSVEDRLHWARAELLKTIPVHSEGGVRFVSNEPLLGPMGHLDLSGIHQMIVGGESGPDFRHMDLDWARGARDLCAAQGVAFFYKQSSGLRPDMNRERDGRKWAELPERSKVAPGQEDARNN